MTQALAIFQKRTRGLMYVLGDKERVENEESVDQMHTGITWGIFIFLKKYFIKNIVIV